MIPLGIYVHFPFCSARCSYCDFTSSVTAEIPHEAYAEAVSAELRFRLSSEDWGGRKVETIYFGGGTPSLWRPAALGRVLDLISAALPVSTTAEITIEANPGIEESGSLKELQSLGLTRISFGTQSFVEAGLLAIGRRHSASDSLCAVERGREAGFSEISIDLMYALPGQSPREAAEDAKKAALCGPDHISAYCLTLHPGTPMEREAREGRLSLPDEESTIEIEDEVFRVLAKAGFVRYEISNFQRNGRISLHNTGHWTGREYMGLGVGAHGFRLGNPSIGARAGGLRYRNTDDPAVYLGGLGSDANPGAEEEPLGPADLLRERMFLGMRMAEGVDLAALSTWSGIEARIAFGAAISELATEGLLELDECRLRPTERGLRFADTVAVRLA